MNQPLVPLRKLLFASGDTAAGNTYSYCGRKFNICYDDQHYSFGENKKINKTCLHLRVKWP